MIGTLEKTGSTSASSSQVSELTTSTYCLQRKVINANKDLEELQKAQPLLFVPQWIFGHLKTLTGISPMETLPLSLDGNGPKL